MYLYITNWILRGYILTGNITLKKNIIICIHLCVCFADREFSSTESWYLDEGGERHQRNRGGPTSFCEQLCEFWVYRNPLLNDSSRGGKRHSLSKPKESAAVVRYDPVSGERIKGRSVGAQLSNVWFQICLQSNKQQSSDKKSCDQSGSCWSTQCRIQWKILYFCH